MVLKAHSPQRVQARHTPNTQDVSARKSTLTITVVVCSLIIITVWVFVLKQAIEKRPYSNNIPAHSNTSRGQLIQSLKQFQQELKLLPTPATIFSKVVPPSSDSLRTLAERIATSTSSTPTTTPQN